MAQPQTPLLIRRAEAPFRAAGGDGASGLALARLYRPENNAFTFQLARIEPGGVSRRHTHAWEQVNWVAAGRGRVTAAGETFEIAAGDCVIFPGGIDHAISNTGDEPLLLVAVLGEGAN